MRAYKNGKDKKIENFVPPPAQYMVPAKIAGTGTGNYE